MGAESDSSIYFYNPSLPAAILFTILFTIPTIVLTWQTCFKHKTFCLLCVPIGGLFEVAGYAARSYSVTHVDDIPSYATSSSLIVMAPLFIAAGNYLCLGRLIISVLPRKSQHLLKLNPVFITRVFVTSDILSLLVQASGSGVASSENWSGKTGLNMLEAGLALQLATNIVFMVLTTLFLKRAVLERRARADAPEGWNRVATVVSISIILIFIRSVYRLIEFAMGFNGYPFTHEWIFYVLEAVPMLPAVSIFCIWYPGRYLPRKRGETVQEDRSDVEENKPNSSI